MARAGVAVDDGCARRRRRRAVYDNVLVAGATLAGAEPWSEKSGDGISLATGHRAADLILARTAARRRARRRSADGTHDATTDDVLGDLMRESLDHCVKCTICETYCPVLERDAAVPGPEVRRPAGRALPRPAASRRPTPRVDYCSGCGICTQVCPQGVHIAEINTQARAASSRSATASSCATGCSRRPTVVGRLGTPVAPLANWTLQQRAAPDRPSSASGSTATRRCRRSPGARSSAGRASTRAPAATGAVAYFHGCGTNYYEPRLAR